MGLRWGWVWGFGFGVGFAGAGLSTSQAKANYPKSVSVRGADVVVNQSTLPHALVDAVLCYGDAMLAVLVAFNIV